MKTKNNKWITNELKMKCKTGIARNKMQKKSASNTEAMHLSEAGFRWADDMKVSRHNLWQIRDAFRAEALEDKGDSLNDGPVMLGQWWVTDVAHEDCDCNGRVEIFQRTRGHVY